MSMRICLKCSITKWHNFYDTEYLAVVVTVSRAGSNTAKAWLELDKGLGSKDARFNSNSKGLYMRNSRGKIDGDFSI